MSLAKAGLPATTPNTFALSGPAARALCGCWPFPHGMGQLVDVAGIDDAGDLRDLLDNPDLQEQIGGFLGEGLKLRGEKFLVGGLVLPAQVFCRVAKLLARLLYVGSHDLICLCGLIAYHFDCLVIAVGVGLSR